MSIECGPASRDGDEDGGATTPRDAAAAVPPGWRLLAGRVPEGGSAAEAGRLEAVLANAEVGVALLGAVPLAGAVDEVKRALDSSGFREVFGGHPPIVQRAVPPPGLPLGEVLDSAFSLEPPLALTPSGGADWVQAVRDAIATTRAMSTMPPGGGARPAVPGSEEAAAQPAPAPPAGDAEARRPFRDRMPALVGCLALAALGGVALALHTARPPEPAASRPPDAGQIIASASDDAFVPGPERSAADGAAQPAPNGGRVEAPGRADPAAGVAAAPDAIEDARPTDDGTAVWHAEGAPGGEPGAAVPPSPATSATSSGGDAREPEAPPGPAEVGRESVSADEPPPAVEAGTPASTPPDDAAPAARGIEAAESGASAPPDAPPAPAPEASAARAEGGSPVSGDRDALHDQASRDGAAPADAGRADDSPGQRGADAPRPDALPPPAPPDADVARRPESPSAPAAAPPAPPPAETAPDRAAQAPVARPAETGPDRAAQAPVARPAETGQSAAPQAPPVAARPAATAGLSPDMIGLLLRRGDAARAQGDLSAARLLYGRAAEAGNAAAALAMGKTFDPDFLASQRAAGLQPQPAVAAAWYRRAAALGDPDAPALLRKLEPRAGAADGGQTR